ncbi:MAG: DUF4097 family beta strand repeat-containing protein [Tetrasphaera sp.]
MEWTFATPEPVELSAGLHAGSLTVVAEARDDTIVTITGRRSEVFDVAQSGRTIVVRPPREWQDTGRHEIHIRLPAESDLDIGAGAADVDLQTPGCRLGEVSAKTGSGSIRIDRVGTAALSSGSGTIRCDEVEQVRAKSGSGDISVGRLSADATISTGSGDVRLDDAAGAVAVKTGSGDLTVGQLAGDVRYGTASGLLTVELVRRGRVDAKTASGGVRLGIAAGTPVWTEIVSAFGRVESHLPHVGEPAPGQDSVRVRVHSASGKVVLVPIDAPPQDAPAPPQDEPLAPQDAPV